MFDALVCRASEPWQCSKAVLTRLLLRVRPLLIQSLLLWFMHGFMVASAQSTLGSGCSMVAHTPSRDQPGGLDSIHMCHVCPPGGQTVSVTLVGWPQAVCCCAPFSSDWQLCPMIYTYITPVKLLLLLWQLSSTSGVTTTHLMTNNEDLLPV